MLNMDLGHGWHGAKSCQVVVFTCFQHLLWWGSNSNLRFEFHGTLAVCIGRFGSVDWKLFYASRWQEFLRHHTQHPRGLQRHRLCYLRNIQNPQPWNELKCHEWQMIRHICPPISTSTTKRTTRCLSSVSSRKVRPHRRTSKPFRRPQTDRPAQKGSAPDWNHLHQPICFSWHPALMYGSCRD